MPTLYECLGVELPDEVNGYAQVPLDGVSFGASFDDPDATTKKETQFYSMLGTRAIWHKGWKAATAVPAAPESWGDFHLQRWELFDTTTDPSECHDLAAAHPDKLQELIALWWAEAGAHQALPLESRDALAILGAERPQLSQPRTRYVYYPGGAEIPESVGAQHPQSLLHARGRARHRHAGNLRCPVLAGLSLRRPRTLHQGGPAEVRVQLGR